MERNNMPPTRILQALFLLVAVYICYYAIIALLKGIVLLYIVGLSRIPRESAYILLFEIILQVE